jgi:hypothetical protein
MSDAPADPVDPLLRALAEFRNEVNRLFDEQAARLSFRAGDAAPRLTVPAAPEPSDEIRGRGARSASQTRCAGQAPRSPTPHRCRHKPRFGRADGASARTLNDATREPETLTPPETQALPAWCLFRIDSRPYTVGLESVAEVVEAEGLVRLPLGSHRVLGLCTFRRDVVPVIALDPAAGPASDLARSDPRPLVLILRIDRSGTIVAEARLEDEGEPRPADPGGPALNGVVCLGGPHKPSSTPNQPGAGSAMRSRAGSATIRDRPDHLPGGHFMNYINIIT